MGVNDETDNTLRLEDLNADLAERFLPNTIFLVCYLMIGIFGNSVTLLVYATKLKITDERYFIPFLAICDLFASATCSILEIVDHRMKVTFKSHLLCKCLVSIGAFFTFTSALILVTVRRSCITR